MDGDADRVAESTAPLDGSIAESAASPSVIKGAVCSPACEMFETVGGNDEGMSIGKALALALTSAFCRQQGLTLARSVRRRSSSETKGFISPEVPAS